MGFVGGALTVHDFLHGKKSTVIVDGSIETRTIARAGAHGGAIAVGGVLVNSVTYLATAKNVKIEKKKRERKRKERKMVWKNGSELDKILA